MHIYTLQQVELEAGVLLSTVRRGAERAKSEVDGGGVHTRIVAGRLFFLVVNSVDFN
jgi:hypothetical protein